MERITRKKLEKLVENLNYITGSPLEYGYRDDEGKFHANAGHYCIGGAYGGYKLERVANEGGGITNPLYMGYVSARECYDLINAYKAGIYDAKTKRV